MMAQEMAMTVRNICSHLAFELFTKSCDLYFSSLLPSQIRVKGEKVFPKIEIKARMDI